MQHSNFEVVTPTVERITHRFNYIISYNLCQYVIYIGRKICMAAFEAATRMEGRIKQVEIEDLP